MKSRTEVTNKHSLIVFVWTRTEDIDSDIDVFLSRLVLGSDGVASRVAPQTHRDYHSGCGVCGLHLDNK